MTVKCGLKFNKRENKYEHELLLVITVHSHKGILQSEDKKTNQMDYLLTLPTF